MENMKSVTRQLRKLITNEDIRKNVTKIYYVYDDEYEEYFYYIYFKEDTVKNWYSDEYINNGTAVPDRTTPKQDINGWLEEIAYVGDPHTFKYYKMTKGFKTIENKYGVKVISEGYYYSPWLNKSVETFKMYTADGCCWEKGLSRVGVKKEVETWKKQLLEIKKSLKNRI